MANPAFTVKDVADQLRITPQMVYNLIKQEEIPAFKVGNAVRVLETDLARYVERQKRVYATKNSTEPAGAPGMVEARHLTSRLGTFVLDDVSFAFPMKETLGVVGPSGSGKTLLLKTLAGLLEPLCGSFWVDGAAQDERDPASRKVGFVFQDYALYPNMDPSRNIAFPAALRHEHGAALEESVRRVADRLKIPSEYLHRHVEALPAGIKQLVAIARAENRDAGLFMMDEPLVHLEPNMKISLRAFLKALQSECGATTIYTFNDRNDAMALSDWLLVLEDGRAAQFGRAKEVYERPRSPRVMELLSALGLNALPCRVKGRRTEPWAFAADDADDGDATLCFRPEDVEPADGPFRMKIDYAQVLDGTRRLAVGALESGQPVRVVVPEGVSDAFSFAPVSTRVFRNA